MEKSSNRSSWIEPRAENGIYYIHEYDPSTKRVDRHSTRTRDRATAEKSYAQWLLSSDNKQDLTASTLPGVMVRYWNTYAKDLASHETVAVVTGLVAEHLAECTVQAFTPARQEKFLDDVQESEEDEDRTLSPATQRRYLGVIHAAIGRGINKGEILCPAPRKFKIEGDDGEGARPATLDELRSLCRVADAASAQRFLTLAMATLSRPIALLDLTGNRINVGEGIIKLHNPEKKRNKKRRPTVPMSPVLKAYLADQDLTGLFIKAGIDPDTKEHIPFIGHRTMFRRLAERAGVTCTAYGIRKASAIWLRRHGVPELDIKGMLGHVMTGSTETYAHMDPAYMGAVKTAIDALFAEVRPSWLASYLPPVHKEEVLDVRKYLNPMVGATGIEPVTTTMSRTAEPHESLYFPQLRAANDD